MRLALAAGMLVTLAACAMLDVGNQQAKLDANCTIGGTPTACGVQLSTAARLKSPGATPVRTAMACS